MATSSSIVESKPVASTVIDVSGFVDVVYSYRCKICSIVFDSSEAVTKHVITTHLQKSSTVLTSITSSVCGAKQTVEQGTTMECEVMDSTGDTSVADVQSQVNAIPSKSAVSHREAVASACLNSIHLTELAHEKMSDMNLTGKVLSRQSAVAGAAILDAGGNPCPEYVDFQHGSSFQNSEDPQGQSYSRQMRVIINGVEVLLSIPDEISLEASGSTKACSWTGSSSTLSSESILTDLGSRLDRLKQHKASGKAEDCASSSSIELSLSGNAYQLLPDVDGVRLGTGEEFSATEKPDTEPIKEYFLCSKCQMGFMALDDCKQHMMQQHPELLSLSQVPDEVPMPPNTVSIGTQAQMYKKPGRKRKVIPVGDVMNLDTEGSTEPSANSDVAIVKKDESEVSSAAFNAVNMLGIARMETDVSGLSKRRVRPPKALVEDYFISRRKHKKRQPSAELYNLSCEISGCTAKFSKPESLSYHMMCHVKDGDTEKLACPECGTTYGGWRVLRMHLWRMHSIDSDLFKCEAESGPGPCQYRTDSLQRLEVHLETHNDSQPYFCHSCDRRFKQRSQLKTHELKDHGNKGAEVYHYSGGRNRDCHICKRAFANQKSLKKHIEIVHDKKKPFLCNTCGHESARKAMLDLHLRTHTGEKPYRCDMCNYTASDHNTLRRHRMRHTGQKQYKCLNCAYSCIQAISLKTHLKNKHPGCEGIYSCDSCQYHTVNKQHWLNHVEDHKNNLINADEQSSQHNSIGTIHVVVSQETRTSENSGQVICVGDRTENTETAGESKLIPQAFGITRASIQQPLSNVEFPSHAYGEAGAENFANSGVEMVEFKGMSLPQGQDLGGRVFHVGRTGQQIVQLSQTSEGYYVIVNDSSQPLNAPVQAQSVEGPFLQEMVPQLKNDAFLQQPTVSSSVQVANGSACQELGTLVYTKTSRPQTDTGLHHILTAIHAQQQQNLEKDADADHGHT